ncbi:hypothetical protein [Iodidimonas sp. SYSU 1G8]|uniref:hypothetical protein n=1 Tax=Iodidimonas sp. SYSU 1G8 TaxID=3133967 RepID=UPI0031FE7A51
MKASFPICVMAVAVITGVAPASAQQIGKTPWDSARSASLSAQFQFQRQMSGGSGGMGALTQYVTNYNSSSTSIGNYTEVVQNLGDGATGSVTQNAEQSNSGTQGSESSTAGNETSNGSDNVAVTGKGRSVNSATASKTEQAPSAAFTRGSWFGAENQQPAASDNF